MYAATRVGVLLLLLNGVAAVQALLKMIGRRREWEAKTVARYVDRLEMFETVVSPQRVHSDFIASPQ